MATEVRNNIALERFEIQVDGTIAGYAEYQDTVSERAFVHTEVDPRFTGPDYVRVLIATALETTYRDGLGALPMCPLVRDFFETRPEFLPMVPHWARDRLGLSR